MSETSLVDLRKCVAAANDSIDSLTEALSNCQEQLRLAEQQLDERCEPLKEVPGEAPSLSHGNPQCWTNQFTSPRVSRRFLSCVCTALLYLF